MAKPEIRMNDSGTTIRVQVLKPDDTVYPLNDCEVIQFKFQKPDGTNMTKPGVLTTDGLDGKVHYTTDLNDFDQTGTWLYQVYFERGDVSHHTDYTRFRVHPNLPLA
jgi:hypothetical protein